MTKNNELLHKTGNTALNSKQVTNNVKIVPDFSFWEVFFEI